MELKWSVAEQSSNSGGAQGVPSLALYSTGESQPSICIGNITVDTQNKVPATTVLQTFKVIKGDEYVINLSTGDVGGENFELYEIAFVNDGQIIQPEGAVKVYIESPYKNAVVARQNSDGSWSLIQSTISNGI